MLYLIAIILPPLALLLCGKPFQAILSAVAWVLAWIFAIFAGLGFFMWIVLAIWAVLVVRDRNTRKILEDIQNSN